MRAIIVYNTMTGNTRDLASKMKNVLEKFDIEVNIHRDNEINRKVRTIKTFFEPYDLLCFGSCTHAWAPALSFSSFLNAVKKHELSGKKLICFATSASFTAWQDTCKNIKRRFPNLEHLGNFGCSNRNSTQTLQEFNKLDL
ncbi:MAG: flavodoxin family protein [Promethearchaeota archaeon]